MQTLRQAGGKLKFLSPKIQIQNPAENKTEAGLFQNQKPKPMTNQSIKRNQRANVGKTSEEKTQG